MARREHKNPTQKEPRSLGETLHDNRIVELGAAPAEAATELLMVGPPRVRALIESCALETRDELETLPGFSRVMAGVVRSGGARPRSRAGLKTRESAA